MSQEITNQPQRLGRTHLSSEWRGGAQSEVTIRGHKLTIDEPESAGGKDKGPRPVEVVLAAYLGCTHVTIHRIAEEMGIKFSGLKVEADGDLMPLKENFKQRGIGRMSVNIDISTSESQERINNLAKELEERCIVTGILRRSGTELAVNWRVHSSS